MIRTRRLDGRRLLAIGGVALVGCMAGAPLAGASVSRTPVRTPRTTVPGGSTTTTTTTTTAVASTTTAPAPAPTTTAPAAGNPFRSLAPPHAAATAHVSIVDFGFSPATISVAAGTTVVWTNTGQSIHSVTAVAGAFDSSPTCPTGPCIDPGHTFSHLFAQAGTFAYHCRVHPGMTGTVVVTAATPSTTTTTAPAGSPQVSSGGAANPTTTSTVAGAQLAFTGGAGNAAWLTLAALLAIAAGLALRPRRRPFPLPVPAPERGHHRSSP